ncbi:MAG: D-alanyl-D-alanine carboxypeptidase [Pseudomonadota bacterium]
MKNSGVAFTEALCFLKFDYALKRVKFFSPVRVLICGLALCALSSGAFANSKYASLVVDAHTGKILHSKHADSLRHPASLTKVMTLYVLFKELKKGQISFDTDLIVTKTAAAQPPSKLGLKPKQRIRVVEAIRALVTKSANDVAATVAENLAGTHTAFAQEMTRTAREMGMKNTVFHNASGLHHPKQVTTASDMIVLAKRMQKDFPEYYHFFKTKHFSYKGRKYRNHNKLLFNYQGTDGIKTGYIRASGFNLVSSVRRKDKHLLAVVMGGRSSKRRNQHMRSLLNKALPQAVAMRNKPNTVSNKNVKLVSLKEPQNTATTQPQNVEYKVASLGPTQIPNIQYFGTHVSKDTKSVAPDTAQQTQNQAVSAIKSSGPFHIQIGAFSGQKEAQQKLDSVSSHSSDLLTGHPQMTMKFERNSKQYVRARFAAFTKGKARSICAKLKKRSVECIVIRAD